MENQTNSNSIIIKYGIILALIIIAIRIFKHATGNTYNTGDFISGILIIAAVITLITLGIKKFKTENNGFLRWGQGVKIGILIALINGTLIFIYEYIFMTFIEPDYIKKTLEMTFIEYQKAGISGEQLEMSLSLAKKMLSPFFMFLIKIIGAAIGGFIVSAIASAVMKKDEREVF